jgi:hypothetical protein
MAVSARLYRLDTEEVTGSIPVSPTSFDQVLRPVPETRNRPQDHLPRLPPSIGRARRSGTRLPARLPPEACRLPCGGWQTASAARKRVASVRHGR